MMIVFLSLPFLFLFPSSSSSTPYGPPLDIYHTNTDTEIPIINQVPTHKWPFQDTTRPAIGFHPGLEWHPRHPSGIQSGTKTIGCALQQCVSCIRSIGTLALHLVGGSFPPFLPHRRLIGSPVIFLICTDSRTFCCRRRSQLRGPIFLNLEF